MVLRFGAGFRLKFEVKVWILIARCEYWHKFSSFLLKMGFDF